MPGKRYKAVTSNAQRRKLFAMARRGELPMHEALGKARAAKGRRLPERVGRKRYGRRMTRRRR
jgi:hypothetical protein